jgi:hypothetical protein
MKMVMNIFIFWDIKPCSPLEINGCFGEKIASIFIFEE